MEELQGAASHALQLDDNTPFDIMQRRMFDVKSLSLSLSLCASARVVLSSLSDAAIQGMDSLVVLWTPLPPLLHHLLVESLSC